MSDPFSNGQLISRPNRAGKNLRSPEWHLPRKPVTSKLQVSRYATSTTQLPLPPMFLGLIDPVLLHNMSRVIPCQCPTLSKPKELVFPASSGKSMKKHQIHSGWLFRKHFLVVHLFANTWHLESIPNAHQRIHDPGVISNTYESISIPKKPCTSRSWCKKTLGSYTKQS